MNIDQLKIMLELQAIRNFDNPFKQTNNEPLFGDILSQFIDSSKILNNDSKFISENTYEQSKLPTFNLNNFSLPINPIQGTNFHSQTYETTNSSKYEHIINQAAEKYNLPANLIKSIITHESNFNPLAVSHAGASGLMQLMPQTARGLGVKDIFNPTENIFGGSKYIRNMLDKYNGNLKLALAAYNAGPGNVDKYNGIPPFKETQNYVKKVLATFYN